MYIIKKYFCYFYVRKVRQQSKLWSSHITAEKNKYLFQFITAGRPAPTSPSCYHHHIVFERACRLYISVIKNVGIYQQRHHHFYLWPCSSQIDIELYIKYTCIVQIWFHVSISIPICLLTWCSFCVYIWNATECKYLIEWYQTFFCTNLWHAYHIMSYVWREMPWSWKQEAL